MLLCILIAIFNCNVLKLVIVANEKVRQSKLLVFILCYNRNIFNIELLCYDRSKAKNLLRGELD
jgi:hypothetical protein